MKILLIFKGGYRVVEHPHAVCKNIHEYILEPMKQKSIDVDVAFCTHETDSDKLEVYKASLNPIKIQVSESGHILNFKTALIMVEDIGNQYDYIIFLRFDIIYKLSVSDWGFFEKEGIILPFKYVTDGYDESIIIISNSALCDISSLLCSINSAYYVPNMHICRALNIIDATCSLSKYDIKVHTIVCESYHSNTGLLNGDTRLNPIYIKVKYPYRSNNKDVFMHALNNADADMLHIYGDSHANFSFRNLTIPHRNHYMPSITMFRIGRDNLIINYDKIDHSSKSIICLVYGEVDCRCHIMRQVNLGRNEDDVISELVANYFLTIKNSISVCKKIVVVGVIPATRQHDLEVVHGPITHEFPFVGSDEDRVRVTHKVNKLLEEMSCKDGYVYFNPYDYYTREDGTFKHELSDTNTHLGDNRYFLENFMELYEKISKYNG